MRVSWVHVSIGYKYMYHRNVAKSNRNVVTRDVKTRQRSECEVAVRRHAEITLNIKRKIYVWRGSTLTFDFRDDFRDCGR